MPILTTYVLLRSRTSLPLPLPLTLPLPLPLPLTRCAVVGMGSASGALYSSNISVRLLPLADVYLPFSKLVSPSMPLGRLLEGSLGVLIHELYAVGESSAGGGGVGAAIGAAAGTGPRSFGQPQSTPHFKYRGAPLPPPDDSTWASLRSLFAQVEMSGGESVASASERLRSELLERLGATARDELQREVAENGALQLPLDLFCVHVGGRDLPVFIEVS